jgi:hypothetical protein
MDYFAKAGPFPRGIAHVPGAMPSNWLRRTPTNELSMGPNHSYSAPSLCMHFILILCAAFAGIGSTQAVQLQASDGANSDKFGTDGSLFGSVGLIGADEDDTLRGTAYVFRNLDAAAGTVTQSAKLIASDRGAFHQFGFGVSLQAGVGLVGALGSNSQRGSAYLYRNLATATGTVIESARLTASDGAANDAFGFAVGLRGNSALVGANSDTVGTTLSQGSVYLFRNLAAATGTINEVAKLTASDGSEGASFGASVSLMESVALIGAFGQENNRGAAYLFRGLDTATGAVTESARLVASDRQPGDNFGDVSLSGNMGLVAASLAETRTGSAYLFRNLDTAAGTITQSAKLIASDRAPEDYFGFSVSLSGSVALIGAHEDTVGSNVLQGSVYLFRNLDSVSGTVTESVQIVASADDAQGYFGSSVSLDGDRFLIGSFGGNGVVPFSGKAYMGSASSLSTLDDGNTSRSIGGISFTSRVDWIVGETTDANRVTLGVGDRASVLTAGKAVFIGKGAGSDGNTLQIQGSLLATEVYIGALAGSQVNTLQLDTSAAFQATAFRLAPDNLLRIEGVHTDINNLLTYLGSTNLQVWEGGLWQTVNNNNYTALITSSFTAGYTNIATAPEPTSAALLLSSLVAMGLRRRRKRLTIAEKSA